MISKPSIRALLLAAGHGTRLRPLTEFWPKCLMPVKGRPVLDYWFSALFKASITEIMVNVHSHKEHMYSYLESRRDAFDLNIFYEPELLGTAGTVVANEYFLRGHTAIVIHADNLCSCDLSEFLTFHLCHRPKQTVMTMMTFDTASPKDCGIVSKDSLGRVIGFREKRNDSLGNCANAAVYLLEPEVTSWMRGKTNLKDFSTDVIPRFIGRIATWHNTKVHRDIGNLLSLQAAQSDDVPQLFPQNSAWQSDFLASSIYRQLSLHLGNSIGDH